MILNLWTSWCGPCKAEMPALEAVWADYREQGLVVLAVNSTINDGARAASAFAEAQGLTFPILMATGGEVSRLYGLRSLPTSFFIDPQGVIREVVVGGPMAEALLRVRARQLLERR